MLWKIGVVFILLFVILLFLFGWKWMIALPICLAIGYVAGRFKVLG